MTASQQKLLSICRYGNSALLIVAALFFFLLPAAIVFRNLSDPNIRAAGIPRAAWSLHRSLTPKYERWAKQRLDTTRAAELSTRNISGTEWPLFGSVFYLWATESLQEAWEKDHGSTAIAPKVYAKDAIEAATRVVIDPGHASWVKAHWGEQYLKRENIFYRMLVIAALTSHARLTGDKQYLPMLSDQVESLSAEVDASPHGLLNDYPNECYPGDVLTAIAMIRKADTVLGTDHGAFVDRAIRGFQDEALDPRGLVPYSAVAKDGTPLDVTRGCGNSYVSLFSPGIWPRQADKWYDLYAKHFWQEFWSGAGFREFPKDAPGNDWYFDVDSGPVIQGYGFAACAFGVGAARVNGHFEHAYPLTAEMLVTSWPLPNGTCLLPRLLSNAADAPYLGEAAILFNLTRMPAEGVTIKTGGSIPWFVVIVLALQLGVGLFLLAAAMKSLRQRAPLVVLRPGMQLGIWVCLVLAAGILLIGGKAAIALLAALCAQLVPRYKHTKVPTPVA